MQSDHPTTTVTLEAVSEHDLASFKHALQQSFLAGIVDAFGTSDGGPIPSDETIEESFRNPQAAIYHIVANGKRSGGAVVVIDTETQRNSLDLFFIAAGAHGQGIGSLAWKAIEQRYPDTKVWETHTPYFEKRNIHFYVNKCGFSIVEFFCDHHPDPHNSDGEELPHMEEMFRFEKHIQTLEQRSRT